MKTVWIVINEWNEGWEIDSVWATQAQAEAYILAQDDHHLFIQAHALHPASGEADG